MHYTSILFDLDGTLLDTLGDLTAAMNRTLTRHGLPERTRQQMRAALGNGARRLCFAISSAVSCFPITRAATMLSAFFKMRTALTVISSGSPGPVLTP